MAGHVLAEDFHSLENRVDGHDIQIAVQAESLKSLGNRMGEIVDELHKTRWTLMGFAFTVAASAIAIVLGG